MFEVVAEAGPEYPRDRGPVHPARGEEARGPSHRDFTVWGDPRCRYCCRQEIEGISAVGPYLSVADVGALEGGHVEDVCKQESRRK